jgi:hypothetical protein
MPDPEIPQPAVHDAAGIAADAGQLPAAGPGAGLQGQSQAAFKAGWLMAQLYGPVIERSGGTGEDHLPSVSGLRRSECVDLSVRELENALGTAAAGISYQQALDAAKAALGSRTWHQAFKDALASLHRLLLIELTVRDPHLGRAYGLGRSLSDTAWLPADPASLQRQLNPYRVAELDGWLSDLPDLLGPDAVTAVRGSLQTWSAWAADPFIGRRRLGWARDGRSVELALRRQGAAWHDLLSGERDPASVLSADAYVQAADVAVHRVGFLARQVLVHFWYAAVLLLAVVGGLVYLAVTYAAGTAKFWSAFVAAAGGFAALVQGVRRNLSNLAQRAEAPLWQVERDDALQAGATLLPAGAAAGRVRRRVSPGQFKRPAAAAIQPPAQQTDAPETPETKPAASGAVRIMPASSSEDAAPAGTEPPDGPA